MDLEFETFMWRGAVRYQCPNCGYDGATQQAVVRHWMESHKPKEEAIGPTLFDADDKPITRSIYVPGGNLPDLQTSAARSTGDPA